MSIQKFSTSKWILSIVAVLGILILAVVVGSVRIPLAELFKMLAGQQVSVNTETIIKVIRLPRVALGFLIGGALAVSGTAVQSVLKNPLASPYTLGVSTGAAFGVSIYLLTFKIGSFGGVMTLPLIGLAGAMGTISLVLLLARKIDPMMKNTTLILMGMVISLFINSIITLMLAVFRQNMDKVIFWQMGSLASRGWTYAGAMLPFFIVGICGLLYYQNAMDILSLGDESAKSLGVEVEKIKGRVLFFAALLTGSAVALSGTIGFIGLVTPHVIRRFTGPAHRRVLPMSILFGGSFLVLADLIARTVVSPSELPVGAITAFIGAPFFAAVFFSKGAK